MNRVIALIFLMLCAGGTAYAQRESDKRDWRREPREESKYPYSKIVRCYAVTASLPSFMRCLDNYESPFESPLWRNRYDGLEHGDELKERRLDERHWPAYRPGGHLAKDRETLLLARPDATDMRE